MDNQQLLMRDLKKFIGFRKGVIEILNFDTEEYEKPNIKAVEATCKCHICNAIFKIKHLSNRELNLNPQDAARAFSLEVIEIICGGGVYHEEGSRKVFNI